jgi:hypothetical protein
MRCSCGRSIDERRVRLGFNKCLECGNKIAAVEIKQRQGRVGLGYNKGGLMLLGSSDERARDALLDSGKKTRAEPTLAVTSIVGVSTPAKVKNSRRKIGFMRIDREWRTWWDGEDPITMGADFYHRTA